MQSSNPETIAAEREKTEFYKELVKPLNTNFPESVDKNECLRLPNSVLKRFNEKTRGELAEGKDEEHFKKKFIDFLESEEGIQGVQVYYPSIEGRLHRFEYDRETFLKDHEEFTFDGSSIKGFSDQEASDLRLKPIFSQFYLAPHRSFGAGRAVMLGRVMNTNGEPYHSDFTNHLIAVEEELRKMGLAASIAPEIEGFLLKGKYAEQNFKSSVGFEMASESGYAGAAAGDDLIKFINELARETRAMGFKNEKDHPEVAKGQFELNYRHTDPVKAAFQVLLYRQMAVNLAHQRGMTATFLPKPKADVNGSGMHTNISLRSIETGKNIFHDAEGMHQLSEKARKFIGGILKYAKETSLGYNIMSGNGARRNDPSKEAPIEIIADENNRAAVVRVPHHTENSARAEVRAAAPDGNPMGQFTILLRAGIKGLMSEGEEAKTYLDLMSKDREIQRLPEGYHQAVKLFESSSFAREALGDKMFEKYLSVKKDTGDRLPRDMGKTIKQWEILGHPLVVNQNIAATY